MSVSKVSGVTAGLCQRTSALTFTDLSESMVNQAKLALLDWLGVTIQGAQSEPAGIVQQVVAVSAPGPFVVVGTALSTNNLSAALINGVQGHVLDFDDTHAPSLLHASAPVWPALLASAPRAVGGRDLLAAYVAGVAAEIEVAAGIGETLSARGLHVTGNLGHLGAAAAVANLKRLSQRRTEQAIGIAATQAAGLTASFGTMSKALHVGKAAMNGLLAALLAENGFTGPAGVLERADGLLATLIPNAVGGVVDEPAAGWVGWPDVELSFKPYPSCLLTHATIDAAVALRRRLGPVPGRIERVDVRAAPLALQLAGDPNPETGLRAKFSLAYCAARSLLTGIPGYTDFRDAAVRDHQVHDLVSRVWLTADETLAPTAATVGVTLLDGQVLVEHVPLATGNPGNPMTPTQLQIKFVQLAEPVLGRAQTDELADAVLHLEDCSTLDRLIKLVVRPPANTTSGTDSEEISV